MLPKLVKIACQAIFMGSIPSARVKISDYYEYLEYRRLQMAVLNYVENDHNGIAEYEERDFLVAYGINPADLTCPALKINADTLADKAISLGILPESYSLAKIRKGAFLQAGYDIEKEFGPQIDEVYDLLDRQNRLIVSFTPEQIRDFQENHREPDYAYGAFQVDYLSWATWRNGIRSFTGKLNYIFSPILGISLFYISSTLFVLMGIISLPESKIKFAVAFFAGFLFFTLILDLSGFISMLLSNNDSNYYFYDNIILMLPAAFIISVISIMTGIKLSRKLKPTFYNQLICLAIFFISLTLWVFDLDQYIYPWYHGWGMILLRSNSEIMGGTLSMFIKWLIIFGLLFPIWYFLVRYHRRQDEPFGDPVCPR